MDGDDAFAATNVACNVQSLQSACGRRGAFPNIFQICMDLKGWQEEKKYVSLSIDKLPEATPIAPACSLSGEEEI